MKTQLKDFPKTFHKNLKKLKKLKINDPPHPGQGGSQGGKASWESPICTNRIGFLKDSDGWLDFIGIRIGFLKDSLRIPLETDSQAGNRPPSQPSGQEDRGGSFIFNFLIFQFF